MDHPTLIVLVRFKSRLSLEEAMTIAHKRIGEFRALGGLLQKYYLSDPVTGEIAGLYLWESKEAFDEFRESELRATIGKSYQTIGEPGIEVYRVIEALRD